MKKAVALLLTIVMVASLNVAVFADPGSFVKSPSLNESPTLVDSNIASNICKALVKITSYIKRSELPAELKAALEKAYASIVGTDDVSTLASEITKLAADKNVDTKKLAVSDLFDIHYENCTDHDSHGAFTITIKPESVKGFFCLLHYNDGKWEVVANAAVDGENITFTIDEFSPFAIVVDTNLTVNPTPTGDSSNIVLYVFIMAASAAAVVILWRRSKKYSA